MATSGTGGDPRGKAIDLSEVHEVLSLLTYQQLNILLVRESKRVRHIRQDEKVISQIKRDRRREYLSDVRLFAYALCHSAISFLGIVGWLSIGTVFGGLVSHNLMSRAVLCNQPVCMWLRFDGEKFWQ